MNNSRQHMKNILSYSLKLMLTLLFSTSFTTLFAVDVYFVPITEVAREANLVPGKIKVVRTNSTGELYVRIALASNSTAVLNTGTVASPSLKADFTVSGVSTPDFTQFDPLDPTNYPKTTLVHFPVGISEVTIVVTPIDDSLIEAREAMGLEIRPARESDILTNPLRYTVSSPSAMTVTIADNDHKARLEIPDPIADEDAVLFGLVGDEDIQRRGVMRVRFDEFTTTTTEFSRNLEVKFLTSGGTQPIATLNTDYKVHYKTSGNDSGGATEETSRIGYDKVNVLGTGLGYVLMAHLVGESDIQIEGDPLSSSIAVLDRIQFSNHQRNYYVYSAGSNGFTLGDWFPATGTVAVTAASANIVGTGTLFTSELSVGMAIKIGSETRTIQSITSNTAAVVTTVFQGTQSGVSMVKMQVTPLVESLPNGTEVKSLSGSSGSESPETVKRVYGGGSKQIRVGYGTGGLFEGDVFQVADHKGFYVVTSDTTSLVPKVVSTPSGTIRANINSRSINGTGTAFLTELTVGDYLYNSSNNLIGRVIKIISNAELWIDEELTVALASTTFSALTPGTDGVLKFRRYQGAGIGSGLEVDTTGVPDITTLIEGTVTGNVMRLLIPSESRKVEFSVAPTVNPDGAEGVEEVRLALVADDDYEILTPQVGSIFIADRDLTASIKVKSNAGLPNQAGFFLIELQGGTFNRSVNVPFTVTQSDGGSGYSSAMPQFVTFVSGQSQAEIQVDPIQSLGAVAVTLTLDSSLSYKRSGSDSSSVNPSATMDIAKSVGTVSLVASIPTAQESPIFSTTNYGEFTLTINRQDSQMNAVNVTLTVAGTAAVGSRYEFLNSSNAVITPINNQIQVTIPTGTSNVTSTVVKVRAINNFLADNSQNVQLSVVDGASYLVGTPSNASVTITDDEPTISVIAAGNALRPSTPGYFTFSYSGAAASQAITVNFTYSGTAVKDTDFTGATSVIIPANRTSEDVAINPKDTGDTSSKSVIVTMTNSTTYNIGTGTATIQIDGEDQPSNNKITPGTVSSGSSGGGCGLGSGLATFALLGLFGLYLGLRRRQH
jgi:hypothetical protein